jgi:hypothetical protein
VKVGKGLAILLLVVIIGCKGGKKPSTQVTGTVTYEDGKPAAGVTIGVDGLSMTAVTNVQGKYTLTGIPSGEQTVVAIKAGFFPAAKFGVQVPQSGRVSNADMVLRPDPKYIPDTIKIEKALPSTDTVLTPGQNVSLTINLRYHMTTASFGSIIITIQDEKKNPLTIAPLSNRVTRPTDTVTFTRNITMPQRIKGEVYVIAALFPGIQKSSEVTDFITYKIRAYKDSVHFSTLLLVPDKNDSRQISLSAVVGYNLDSLPTGIVRLRVLGDEGKKEFKTPVYETQQNVDKSAAASGTLDFQTRLSVPSNVVALKVNAELVTPDGKTILFDASSSAYPVKKSQ